MLVDRFHGTAVSVQREFVSFFVSFLLCFVLVVPLPDVFYLFRCSDVLISVCCRSTLIEPVV